VIASPTSLSSWFATNTLVRGVVMSERNFSAGSEYGGWAPAIVNSQSLCKGSDEVLGSQTVI
jgi:hypothetical protein